MRSECLAAVLLGLVACGGRVMDDGSLMAQGGEPAASGGREDRGLPPVVSAGRSAAGGQGGALPARTGGAGGVAGTQQLQGGASFGGAVPLGGAGAAISSLRDASLPAAIDASTDAHPRDASPGCMHDASDGEAGACPEGFGECDGDPATVCEADIATSLAHCGPCCLPCVNLNGTTSCRNGTCAPTCAHSHADCDGDPHNGCETRVETSPANCGGCRVVCSSVNGTASCALGACSIACDWGFDDCDGDVSNGCECTWR